MPKITESVRRKAENNRRKKYNENQEYREAQKRKWRQKAYHARKRKNMDAIDT